MKTKFILIALLAIFFNVSCDNVDKSEDELIENNIVSINYRYSVGGRMGGVQDLTVTPDSNFFYELHKGLTLYKSTATPIQLWNNLVSNCNLFILKKIESGTSLLPVDGVDEEFVIQTKEEKLSVLNGYNSEYYEQQDDFFEILREQMHIYGVSED
jgi:hypothetical protein